MDAAYDWIGYNAFRSFSFSSGGVNNLNNTLQNDGFYPGENSWFLRFLENQDEDRISYIYNSFERTMPIATVLFTVPGLPVLHYGQEVGFGKGMGQPGEPDLNTRRRGIIDWNFGGQQLLQPHYQRLAHIRGQFPAFNQHKKDTNNDGQVNSSDASDFLRISTGDGIVFAFLRPWKDENGITVVNFSNSVKTVTLNLVSSGMIFTEPFDAAGTYWVNDLIQDSSYQVIGSELVSFQVTLDAYGSAIFAIGTEAHLPEIPPLPTVVSINKPADKLVSSFALKQNFPNPFNPETTIEFTIPVTDKIKLVVYNILGEKIKTLLDKRLSSGRHQLTWDGTNESGGSVASGIYLLRLSSSKFSQVKRMVLLR